MIPKNAFCVLFLAQTIDLSDIIFSFFVLADDEQVEFGTVLIYSCSKSCWNETIPHAEQVVYFADPDLKYFRSQTVS